DMRQWRQHELPALDRVEQVEARGRLTDHIAGRLGGEQLAEAAQQRVQRGALLLTLRGERDRPEGQYIGVGAVREQPLTIAFIEQALLDVRQRRVVLPLQDQQRGHLHELFHRRRLAPGSRVEAREYRHDLAERLVLRARLSEVDTRKGIEANRPVGVQDVED